MFNNFFNSTFVVLLISIIFIFICFSSVLTTISSNNEIQISSNSIILPNDLYFNTSNSIFFWPTPRL